MTDLLRLLFFFFCAVNPAAAAAAVRPHGARLDTRVLAIGGVIAVTVLLALVFLSEHILEGLGVEPETFRVAAGVVLLVNGAVVLCIGEAAHTGEWTGLGAGVSPFALPVLMTPAAVAASISYGADEPDAKVAVAVAVALVLAAAAVWAKLGRFTAATDGVARVTGALLIAVAAGLIVHGIRDI
jgi:multiple antibiotic resistance protein